MRSIKQRYNNELDQKMKGQGKEYETMLSKYVGVKKDLDTKVSDKLETQEDRFARKKRERRERSISKSMDKGRKKKDDDDPVDTTDMLGDLASTNDRKKKFESGDLDTPFA